MSKLISPVLAQHFAISDVFSGEVKASSPLMALSQPFSEPIEYNVTNMFNNVHGDGDKELLGATVNAGLPLGAGELPRNKGIGIASIAPLAIGATRHAYKVANTSVNVHYRYEKAVVDTLSANVEFTNAVKQWFYDMKQSAPVFVNDSWAMGAKRSATQIFGKAIQAVGNESAFYAWEALASKANIVIDKSWDADFYNQSKIIGAIVKAEHMLISLNGGRNGSLAQDFFIVANSALINSIKIAAGSEVQAPLQDTMLRMTPHVNLQPYFTVWGIPTYQETLNDKQVAGTVSTRAGLTVKLVSINGNADFDTVTFTATGLVAGDTLNVGDVIFIGTPPASTTVGGKPKKYLRRLMDPTTDRTAYKSFGDSDAPLTLLVAETAVATGTGASAEITVKVNPKIQDNVNINVTRDLPVGATAWVAKDHYKLFIVDRKYIKHRFYAPSEMPAWDNQIISNTYDQINGSAVEACRVYGHSAIGTVDSQNAKIRNPSIASYDLETQLLFFCWDNAHIQILLPAVAPEVEDLTARLNVSVIGGKLNP